MNTLFKIRKHILLLTAALGISLLNSCTEEIDTSDRFTFTEKTTIDYLEDYPERYGEYTALLAAVNASDFSQSKMNQLLSARGCYTCFVPTNEAIQKYLEQLKEKGVISEASWDAPEFKAIDTETQTCVLLEETRKTIVYNSLIDHGDTPGAEPYTLKVISELAPVNGLLDRPNFMDRKLTCSTDDGGQYFINDCKIDRNQCDIYTLNGRIHQVEQVISPNTQKAGDYFKETVTNQVGDFYAFACMIDACGLREELSRDQDEAYYEMVMKGQLQDLDRHPTFPGGASQAATNSPGYLPQRKYIGYTIFAEDDAWWESALGLEGSIKDLSPGEVVERIADYVIQNRYYLETTHNATDYTDPDNALNQFVTYHIIPGKLEPEKLVIHFNELHYNLLTRQKTASVFDYYCTMGKRRLVKTYEASNVNRNTIFLNRFPDLKNGRSKDDNYTEIGCDEDKKGVEIIRTGNPELYNAFMYRLKGGCLYYNEQQAENMAGERIRIDFSSMFPELLSNNIRANPVEERKYQCVGFPEDTKYKYLENCEIRDGTRFYYLSGRIGSSTCWQNYQGDELNIVGNYEITIKLPPVPKTGVYELRLGVSVNDRRGMCQVYWGNNPNNLPAADIPLDMRMGGVKWYIKNNGYMTSLVNFQDDVEDETVNIENDKMMRNQKTMKAPNSYYIFNSTKTMRNQSSDVLRRIILRENMEADKTYYLRMKSVLNDPETELYLDYLEYCPKMVYDNPVTPEDIW